MSAPVLPPPDEIGQRAPADDGTLLIGNRQAADADVGRELQHRSLASSRTTAGSAPDAISPSKPSRLHVPVRARAHDRKEIINRPHGHAGEHGA